MNHDPYSTCPCGSGKKLKFCCADILPELVKIHRLEENQPEAAEKLLLELLQKFPGREVLVGEMCGFLRQQGRGPEAREFVAEFLKQHPDHPRGLVWMARLCLSYDGYEASRRLIHRTFQISSRHYPAEIAEIANAIGLYLVSIREFMGGREHIGLSVRLAGTERGRQFLTNLAMLEADSSIPYLLRTPHALLPVTGSEEITQQDIRARKLSLIGCWEPAAILYTRLSEANPENGAILYNLGLCKAWDGRSAEAAAILHRAATLLTDFDQAVQAEALAQVLDQGKPEHQYKLLQHVIRVHSLSQLLSRFDEDVHLNRYNDDELEQDNEENDHWPSGTARIAVYDLLDRANGDRVPTRTEEFARILADIDVVDVVDESSARAVGINSPFLLVTVAEDHSEAVLNQVKQIAGDSLTASDGESPEPDAAMQHPLDARDFDLRLSRPDGVSKSRFRDITSNLNNELSEKWLNRPNLALDGKTPLQAAGDSSLKVRLAAAVLRLDVNARYFDRTVNVDDLFSRLQLPSPAAADLQEGQHCAALPAFHLERLDCTKLDDAQLEEYCNRASMLGFAEMAQRGLDELLNRPAALESFGVVRACLMRGAIARSHNDMTTMESCLEKARQSIPAGREHFREQLEIEIRELAMRLEDPEDPALTVLLHRIRDRYVTKLPEIGEVIQAQLIDSGCEHLLSEIQGGLATSAAGSKALWTPESASQPSSEAGGGLWLPPGQD